MRSSSEWLRHVGLDIGSEGGDSQAFYDAADELDRLATEIALLRLTEAEHDALEFAVETGRVAIHDEAILRKLLERLNHDAVPEARAAEPESSVPPGSVAAPANTHTLTAEEREAIEAAIIGGCEMAGTLRNLLARLHT
jgi:hypothetical protein